MQKRLVRKNKKFLGVCGGLGDYFDQDPTFIRILFVASVLLFGTGVLLYIIMAIVMPEEAN
jgi:phage shock protein C